MKKKNQNISLDTQTQQQPLTAKEEQYKLLKRKSIKQLIAPSGIDSKPSKNGNLPNTI